MPIILSRAGRPFIAPWLLAGLLGLGGCATPSSAPRDPRATVRQHILGTAERMIGTPYILGGEAPGGVDCSGLVRYVYRQAGIQVPRTTTELFQAAQAQRQVLPGDLLFFRADGGGRISHVGIYAGGGQMIHASSGSGQVRKVSLQQPYWRRRMVGGATFLSTGASPITPITQRWPANSGPNG
ncbi:MAG: C40 family peptidase [Candidatus Contendobacter sp.]|nr:C40 family peptidase [Candidatus Contendobacter sp.]MDS4059170.1 C40 family peptidase [Candidatus Contendobacter sp.]